MLGDANSWGPTLRYGFAHYGKSLFWYSSEILFAYFLTESAGLASERMSVVLAVGFLVSATIDLCIGNRMRQTLADAGAAGKMQLLGAGASSIALTAFFAGTLVPTDIRFGYALTTSVLFRVSFALYDIPQNALMALATDDDESRLRLSSVRIWFSGLATLSVAFVVGPLAANQSRSGPSPVLPMTLLFAAVAVCSSLLLARRLPAQHARPVSPCRHEGPWRPKTDFWLILLLALLTTVLTPAFSKLEPYLAAYALHSEWWGGAIIGSMAIGISAGQPLWHALGRHIHSPQVLTCAALLQMAALACFWHAGSGGQMLTAAFAFGVGNGGVGTIQWAAFSGAVARGPRSQVGLAYGVFAAANKVGLAAGGVLIGCVLGAMDYRNPDGSALLAAMTIIPATAALLIMFVSVALLRLERTRILHEG